MAPVERVPLERQVKKLVRDVLTGRSWFFMPVAGRFGAAGVPDFVGVRKGLFFAVETKRAGGSMTKLQKIVSTTIKEHGGLMFLIEGTDMSASDWPALLDFVGALPSGE
jgi:hypothetical protein